MDVEKVFLLSVKDIFNGEEKRLVGINDFKMGTDESKKVIRGKITDFYDEDTDFEDGELDTMVDTLAKGMEYFKYDEKWYFEEIFCLN